MEIEQRFSTDRIVFLEPTLSKDDCILELARLVQPHVGLPPEEIADAVRRREEQLSTYVGHGVALPHARMEWAPSWSIALGVIPEGLQWDAAAEDYTHIVVLIVYADLDQIQLLSSIARLFSSPLVRESVIASETPEEVLAALKRPGARARASLDPAILGVARSTAEHAFALAKETSSRAVLLHPDGLGTLEFLERRVPSSPPVFLITRDTGIYDSVDYGFADVIQLPFRGLRRSNIIEMSLLFILSKGVLQKGDTVISVFGDSESRSLDSIVYTDIDREFAVFFSLQSTRRPRDLQEVVFSRVIQLASELAEEGREGKPAGTLFVLGDYERVARHTQQLVINPFHGYDDDECNILDPILEETVKEFSRIDGAFVISGDGVIQSAGTYIRTEVPFTDIPSGLGARHAAAAAITSVTSAVAVAVSESTKRISIFSNGERVRVW